MLKLDYSMQSLLDNIRVNRRGSGRGSITLAYVVAIYRDQLSVVALVPSSAIGGGSSTLVENSTPGHIGVSSSNGIGVAASVSQAASSKLSTIGLL